MTQTGDSCLWPRPRGTWKVNPSYVPPLGVITSCRTGADAACRGWGTPPPQHMHPLPLIVGPLPMPLELVKLAGPCPRKLHCKEPRLLAEMIREAPTSAQTWLPRGFWHRRAGDGSRDSVPCCCSLPFPFPHFSSLLLPLFPAPGSGVERTE